MVSFCVEWSGKAKRINRFRQRLKEEQGCATGYLGGECFRQITISSVLILTSRVVRGVPGRRETWTTHREDLSSRSVEPCRQRDSHEGIEVTRNLVNLWDCEEPTNSTGSEEGEALSWAWGREEPISDTLAEVSVWRCSSSWTARWMCCLRKIKGCRLAEKPGNKEVQFRSQNAYGTLLVDRSPFVYMYLWWCLWR